MKITYTYAHSIEDRTLDQLSEQALWDAATDAAMQYRLLLVKFWSTATPRRRAEAERNKATLEGKKLKLG